MVDGGDLKKRIDQSSTGGVCSAACPVMCQNRVNPEMVVFQNGSLPRGFPLNQGTSNKLVALLLLFICHARACSLASNLSQTRVHSFRHVKLQARNHSVLVDAPFKVVRVKMRAVVVDIQQRPRQA